MAWQTQGQLAMYGSKWDEAGIQMLGRSILDGVTGDGSLKFKELRIYVGGTVIW